MGEIKMIDGVIITDLKRFPDERGTVMHMMKASDEGFAGFGEVYCSSIYPGVVKGWHYHGKITLNYVVLKGMIKFVLYDEREDSLTKGTVQEIFMGEENYVRVTVPPGIWSGFKCVGFEPALVCNVTDLPHDPSEAKRCDPHVGRVPYSWGRKDR
ncbi:MAG: dTDP-4-dehydrorhamnose 3,5-epimerase [bacterium]|nr:dTDP-4-dehydrorhamnose 3,5-epimerase [bacterium]